MSTDFLVFPLWGYNCYFIFFLSLQFSESEFVDLFKQHNVSYDITVTNPSDPLLLLQLGGLVCLLPYQNECRVDITMTLTDKYNPQ